MMSRHSASTTSRIAPSAARQRWPAPRFSLRAALLFVAALCALMAWRLEHIRRIRRAPQRLEALGGTIRYARDFGSAATFDQSGIHWRELLFGGVACPDVVEVYLNQTPITDDDLAVLRYFPSLRELDVQYTGVTDRGLAYLEATNLKTLWLAGTQATEAGIGRLQQRLPECEIIQ